MLKENPERAFSSYACIGEHFLSRRSLIFSTHSKSFFLGNFLPMFSDSFAVE